MKVRFYWDFFGPRAKGTAQHFERHLRQFLEAHSLTLKTGTSQCSDNQVAVFCDVPDLPSALQTNPVTEDSGVESQNIADQVGRALRPNRVEEHPEAKNP